MKRNFNIIFLIVLFCPIVINALSGQIILTCDSEVIGPGDTLNCSISGNNFSIPISSFHAKITLGEGLTLISSTVDSSWNGLANDEIYLYTLVNKTGEVNFASFVVKANDLVRDNTNISIEEITVSDDKFKEYSFGVVTKEIDISSDSGSGDLPEEHIFNISDTYEVFDGIIANIDVGTTIDSLEIEANHNLIFYNADGEIVESGRLMTGYKVTDGIVDYALIIKGDINGDGYSDRSDVRLLARYILDIDILEELYLLAADFDFNNSVDINDVIKIVAYINMIDD